MSKALRNVIALNGIVDVKSFGARGDGVADDTAAFEAAHQTGKLVTVPAGTYILERVTVTGIDFVGLHGPDAILQLKANDGGGGIGYLYDITEPGDFYLHVKEVFANRSAVKAGNNDYRLINIRTLNATRNTRSIIVENTRFRGSAQGFGQLHIINAPAGGVASFGKGAENIVVTGCSFVAYGNRSGLRVRGAHKNVTVTNCYMNNDGETTASVGSDGKAIAFSGEFGSETLGNIYVSGVYAQYVRGAIFGQTFENMLLDGIEVNGNGRTSTTPTHGYACTAIKIDDIGPDATFTASNVNIRNTGTDSAQYAFSCEESTPNTTGYVNLENWTTDAQVRLTAIAKGYRVSNSTFSVRAGGTGPTYNANMLTSPNGLAEVSGCTFTNLVPAFNAQNNNTVYNDNHFIDSNVVINGTANNARFLNNVFSGSTLTDAFVLENFNNAAPVRIVLDGNIKAAGAGIKNIRHSGTAANLNGSAIVALNNTLDWSYSTLDTNSNTPIYYVRGNTGITDKITPELIAASATPSIQGKTSIRTDGSGNSITNFANGRTDHLITVYLASGDTIVNGASIVNKSAANITGPAVRQYAFFNSVWYEM